MNVLLICPKSSLVHKNMNTVLVHAGHVEMFSKICIYVVYFLVHVLKKLLESHIEKRGESEKVFKC